MKTVTKSTFTPQGIIDYHKITMKAEFIPLSKSRNAKSQYPTLNWSVHLYKDGKEILVTEYSAGAAHCPSYKAYDKSMHQAEAVAYEVENGLKASSNITASMVKFAYPKTPIFPSLTDVVYSLITDSDALEYSTFESWALSCGYDPDSRAAEKIYRACLDIALKLRSGLGNGVLEDLRLVFQDY